MYSRNLSSSYTEFIRALLYYNLQWAFSNKDFSSNRLVSFCFPKTIPRYCLRLLWSARSSDQHHITIMHRAKGKTTKKHQKNHFYDIHFVVIIIVFAIIVTSNKIHIYSLNVLRVVIESVKDVGNRRKSHHKKI